MSAQAAPGRSKIDAARETLLQGIVDGTWPIGARIPKESELMELLGVGKSTVREAVKSLHYVGILEPIKGVGTFVRSMTPVNGMLDQHFSSHSVDQILLVRRALEIEAAQQAAMNRSETLLQRLRESLDYDRSGSVQAPSISSRGEMPGSFHHLIFQATESPLMLSLFTSVMTSLREAKRKGLLLRGGAHDLRHHDHGRLLDAIEHQDVAQAAHAMALHVDRDLIPIDGFAAEIRAGVRAGGVDASDAGAGAVGAGTGASAHIENSGAVGTVIPDSVARPRPDPHPDLPTVRAQVIDAAGLFADGE